MAEDRCLRSLGIRLSPHITGQSGEGDYKKKSCVCFTAVWSPLNFICKLHVCIYLLPCLRWLQRSGFYTCVHDIGEKEIDRETDRETDRQTDRGRERQTAQRGRDRDRQTETDRDRQRHRQTHTDRDSEKETDRQTERQRQRQTDSDRDIFPQIIKQFQLISRLGWYFCLKSLPVRSSWNWFNEPIQYIKQSELSWLE